MSFAKHREAMEMLGRLKTMDTETVQQKAMDEGSEYNSVWATAGITSIIFRDLETEGRDILWTKLEIA